MTRQLQIGAALLCLLPLAACSREKAVTRPPDIFTNPTPMPEWEGRTNGDLVEYSLELKAALGRCNADKAAMRGAD